MDISFNVLASVYRGLLDILDENNLPPAQVATDVGVELQALKTPQAKLSLEQITKLWEMGYELRGPTIGIEVAQRVKFVDFQDVGVLLASTENIADWLAQLDRYSRLFTNVAQLTSERTSKGLEVTIQYFAEVPLKHERLEFLALFGPSLASQYLDSPLKLTAAELTRPKPSDPTPWAEAFGTNIRWNSRVTKYTLDYEEATRQILTRNQQTKQGFQAILDSRLKLQQAAQPLDEVRAAILSSLSSGGANINTIASQLNVSARSLQRRLTAAHTSFSELLSRIRAEQAKAYLDQNVSIPKVAKLLGYSDTAVFRRAFKKWTGTPPKENQ